jgi:aldehyde:ferredoxin oxidoreductase
VRFIRGRGVARWLYWDVMGPDAEAFDSQSRLLFLNGPMAGSAGRQQLFIATSLYTKT